MTFSDPNPDFKVTVILKSAISRRWCEFSIVQGTVRGSTETVQKLGSLLNFFAKSAQVFYTSDRNYA